MPASADLLLDTSAAIALVDPDHEFHLAVRGQAVGRTLGLAGHAEFETYSVLTRRPMPKRLSSAAAERLLAVTFPGTHYLPESAAATLVSRFAAVGIAGGAVYDALVGATAVHHRLPLLTCDAHAVRVYQALGVTYQLA